MQNEQLKRKRFNITVHQDQLLEAYCEETGLNQSEAVQYALEFLFDENKRSQMPESFEVQRLNELVQAIDNLGHQMASDRQSIVNRLDALVRYNEGVDYLNMKERDINEE